MVKVLIVTQGELAPALLQSAKVISGETRGMRALVTAWGEGLDATREQIADAVASLDEGDGVLVLTDLHGATPTNAALQLAEAGKVEVVCGVNVPMVVRLACHYTERQSVSELADWISDKGRRSVRHLIRNCHPLATETRA